MATIEKAYIQANLTVQLNLNEQEVRALDAMFGYGVEEFLKTFYSHMGEHYLKPNEAGIRSLFETVRGLMSGPIDKINEARKLITQVK